MNQFNTWVVSPLGDLVNLQYTAQVVWGGNMDGAGQATQCEVFLIGTGQQAPAVWTYNSPTQAAAAAGRLRALILDGGGSTVSGAPLTLLASDTATTAAGAGVIITLTGTGFSNGGTVTIDGVNMPAGSVTSGTSLRFVLDPTIPAGTYDIEYTDESGNAAVLTNGITLA